VAYFSTLLLRGTEGKLLEISQDRLPQSRLKPSNYRTQVRLVTTFPNLLGLVTIFTLDCRLPWLVQFCDRLSHIRDRSGKVILAFYYSYNSISRETSKCLFITFTQ